MTVALLLVSTQPHKPCASKKVDLGRIVISNPTQSPAPALFSTQGVPLSMSGMRLNRSSWLGRTPPSGRAPRLPIRGCGPRKPQTNGSTEKLTKRNRFCLWVRQRLQMSY